MLSTVQNSTIDVIDYVFQFIDIVDSDFAKERLRLTSAEEDETTFNDKCVKRGQIMFSLGLRHSKNVATYVSGTESYQTLDKRVGIETNATWLKESILGSAVVV